MSEKEKQMLVSEVNILREFRHAHIVRYYDRIIDRENKIIFIVMEYCENGDLGSYIKRCRREGLHIDEETIWRVFTQILLALKECHERPSGKVLHRDLKPGNIFLDSQKNVKLGDFGLARILSKSTKWAHTNVGTPYYMSPEQVTEKAYNERSDIWSLGCLIYELAALSPPFEASNQISLAIKIRAGTFRDLPSRYSSELNRLIRQMLQVSQSRRPSVAELLGHPRAGLCLRERKIASQSAHLKRREEDLDRREASLVRFKESLSKREAAIRIREKELELTTTMDALDPLDEERHTSSSSERRESIDDDGCCETAPSSFTPRSTTDELESHTHEHGALHERTRDMSDKVRDMLRKAKEKRRVRSDLPLGIGKEKENVR
jgi:NIMA (never in mitosis gene a)-related kinase 2